MKLVTNDDVDQHLVLNFPSDTESKSTAERYTPDESTAEPELKKVNQRKAPIPTRLLWNCMEPLIRNSS